MLNIHPIDEVNALKAKLEAYARLVQTLREEIPVLVGSVERIKAVLDAL